MTTNELIPVIKDIKIEQINGSFIFSVKDETYTNDYSWSGKTYASVAGAKRSIASQIKHGYYGNEQWNFIIVETKFIRLNGTTWVDVHVYEKKISN